MSDLPPRRNDPVLYVAAALVVLRAAFLPWIILLPQEAYYWNYSQHLDFGYLDHPPLVAWLIRVGVACFGHGELGVRVFALLGSLVTSFFVYRLTARWHGPRAGWMAVLLVQLLPFFFMVGWIMTPDAPLTACWAGALYFLARALLDERPRAWLGVGICLGLGMFSKYTMALLGPATLLFLLLDRPSRVWFRRLPPYGAVLLAAAIFSPVVVWNMTHHWASFAFQSTGRLQAQRHFALPVLAGSILLLLTPPGVFLAGRALIDSTDARRRLFVRIFTLVPLTVFVVASLTHRVKLNWTGPLWLAVVPGMAAFLVSLRETPARWWRLGWLATAAILVAGYGIVLPYLAVGLPGISHVNTTLLPVGWPDLSRDLERQKNALRQAGSSRVLIVGMDRDFIASETAFYQPDQAHAVQETTATHLFGGEGLMYAYWFPPVEQDGATLLLVGFDRAELDMVPVRRRCQSLGPIEEQTLWHDGRPVRTYYTRVGYNYRSRGYGRRRQP